MLRQDYLRLCNEKCFLEKADGSCVDMPNLTDLVAWYKKYKTTEIGQRIKEILSLEFGELLVVEIMVNMAHEKTLERLKDGEIKRNLSHVKNYYIILDSQIEDAKQEFALEKAKGRIKGNFEDAFFAHFPSGMVIMRERFPSYLNKHYDRSDLDNLLSK